MHRVLLDTDVFSEVLKATNRDIARVARAYRAAHGSYTISAITVTEVVRGWEKRAAAERLQRFLDALADVEVLHFDSDAAVLAGRITGELERRGMPIGLADPMIASIAITNALPLVTGNLEHFNRIVRCGYSLRVEPWP